MASRKSTEENIEGSAKGEIAVGAVIAVIGAVLGFAQLAVRAPTLVDPGRPAAAAKAQEEEGTGGGFVPFLNRAPAPVEVVMGTNRNNQGWKTKRAALGTNRPGSHGFEVGELNEWVRQNFKAAPVPKDAGGLGMYPQTPNLNILEGKLQGVLPIKLTTPAGEMDLYLVARGTLEAGGGVRLVIEETRVGRAKVPGLLGLPQMVAGKFAGPFAASEEMVALETILANVTAVSLENGRLELVLP